jgi:hypothetical protein
LCALVGIRAGDCPICPEADAARRVAGFVWYALLSMRSRLEFITRSVPIVSIR